MTNQLVPNNAGVRSAGEVEAGERAAVPTLDEIRTTWPATVSIATAAPVFGISKSYFHQLIARGEAPCRVLKIGTRCRVVTASMVAVLGGS